MQYFFFDIIVHHFIMCSQISLIPWQVLYYHVQTYYLKSLFILNLFYKYMQPKVSPNIYTPTCYDYMNMHSIKRLTMKIKPKCTLYLFTPISLQRSELSFPLMRTVSHFSSFLCFDFFCCVIWTLNDVSFYGENDFSISEICS